MIPLDQVAIVLFGVGAVYLTQQQRRPDWKRYACLLGMAGQPFWFYAAWQTGQVGIFIIVCLYTYVWALGIYNNWLKASAAIPSETTK